MADPKSYTPGYSFSGWQASYPTRPLPAPEVDTELANISQSTEELMNAIKDIRRSDGKLKNKIVTLDSLDPAVALALGSNADLEIIVDNIDSITAVAGIDVEVQGVYGIRNDVTSVAAIAADVTTTAAISANVTVVAGNIGSVNLAAANMAVIQSAPENAQLAKDYATKATDEPVEPGLFSAYHWAQKAAGFAATVNPANLVSYISQTPTAPQQAQARSNIDALGPSETPDKAFRRGNILGTVSQVAGVPAGAIIERGSNANGRYVRYADGTQICWIKFLGSSTGVKTLALPAPFANNDYAFSGNVDGVAGSTNTAMISVKPSAQTTTSVGVVTLANGAYNALSACATLHGDWF